jgi:hypothetical protein
MEARPEGADRLFDEELTAFLRREATRRTHRRRADQQVVASIVGRQDRRPRARLATAVATSFLAVLVVVAIALEQARAPVGTGTPTPRGSDSPSALPAGLPVVAPGQDCPVTERWLIGTDLLPAGAAVGGAPVYAFLAESGHPAYFESAGFGGWQRIDVLWAFEPGFDRDFFVHAARLDGSGAVSFGDLSERVPVDRVEVDASSGKTLGPAGWRVLGPLPMLVREPGCYGLQVDTDRGSSVSVFQVVPVEEAWEELEAHSLDLPDLALDEPCPVTPAATNVSFVGGALGDGPVYLSASGRAFWVVDARELGPVLIRGRRIDVPGGLRFDVGDGASAELRLPIHSDVHSASQPPGWRQFISTIDPSVPGCYAVQIDTLTATESLILAIGLD